MSGGCLATPRSELDASTECGKSQIEFSGRKSTLAPKF